MNLDDDPAPVTTERLIIRPDAPFEVIEFHSEAEWKAARREWIGASEMASVMGVNDYHSNVTLWSEKRGLLPPEDEAEVAAIGKVLEPAVANLYARETKRTLTDLGRFTILKHKTLPIACTLDRIVTAPQDALHDGPGTLELKTSTYPGCAEEWQDEPPLMYQIQLMTQLLVTGFKWGSLCALLFGRDLKWQDLQARQDVFQVIADRALDFWKCVREGRQPEADHARDAKKAVVRAHPGVNTKTLVGDDTLRGLDDEIAGLKETLKAIEERIEQKQTALYQAFGDAGSVELPGGVVYVLSETPRAGYTVQPTTVRQWRRKAGKKQLQRGKE